MRKEGLSLTNLLIRLFIKDFKNTNAPAVRESYGQVASITGIATNFFLFLIKVSAGLLFNSISIIADAVNNLSDSGSSLIALLGFKLSGKPADSEHPFGHARMEYISGLIVSFVVLFLGIELIKTSADKIMNPETVQFSFIAVAVLVVSILVKLWQGMFYKKMGKTINSLTLAATSVDSRNDVIATSAVLVALILTRLTGFNLDGYMGVVVAVIIILSGVRLVKDTISPLLGVAPEKELVNEIYRKIMSYEGIIGLHDLTVHNYGVNRCFASVHCEVPSEQDIMLSHDIIDNIERDFSNDMGINMVIHLDPVVTSDERTNELKVKVGFILANISNDISMHDFRVVWGISHSNLIFDIVVPFGSPLDDDELVKIISEEIKRLDKTYNAVITVDHSYVPD
jgi:cation diffusion facilitator family transporter